MSTASPQGLLLSLVTNSTDFWSSENLKTCKKHISSVSSALQKMGITVSLSLEENTITQKAGDKPDTSRE